MKIKYQFANGETSEVEVEESVGNVILDSRRKEENLSRKERYHNYSLDGFDYHGNELGAEDTYDIENEEKLLLSKGIETLSDIQKRRLFMLADGMSLRQISRCENVDIKTVRESINGAKKKIKIVF